MSTMAPTTTETRPQPDVLPNLTLEVLTKRNDKLDAINLVADSVAQQRQVASRILIFHPYCLAALALAMSIGHYVTAVSGRDDAGAFIVTYGGVALAYLLTIRYFTGPYLHLAEETNWIQWLQGQNGVDDVVIGARYGSDIIGAVVLRLESIGKKDSTKGKAVIRAWTIKNKYRGKGLGADMLAEAVLVARKSLGQAAKVEFAEDHANGALYLHSVFNQDFLARDARASKALLMALSG